MANKQKESVNLIKESNVAVVKAEHKRKALIKHYKSEEKFPMYLSPMYRPYFGTVMPVMVNGITIYFKVDGSTQMIPKTFANEVQRKRMAIDAILTKQSRMADVSGNFESTPGELNLF